MLADYTLIITFVTSANSKRRVSTCDVKPLRLVYMAKYRIILLEIEKSWHDLVICAHQSGYSGQLQLVRKITLWRSFHRCFLREKIRGRDVGVIPGCR
ncbi:hypothetical protein ABG067_002761 [Albugo candida]